MTIVTTLSPAALSPQPLAPLWGVAPICLLTLFFLGIHLTLLHRDHDMPESRRRLRTANGLLMLIATPIAGYAFGVASPARDQRLFVLAWILVTALVVLILILAIADALNSWRIDRRARQQRLSDLLESELLATQAKAQTGNASAPTRTTGQ